MKSSSTMIKIQLAVNAAGLLLLGIVAEAAGIRVDHGGYARLLKQPVADGVVDNRGFKTNEDALDRYLETLATVDPEALSAPDRFAFYANAYNAWTIKRSTTWITTGL